MKIVKTNEKNILGRCERLFSAPVVILMAVLILSLVANSQSPVKVNLGSADDFMILAKTGISATGVTSITGDIGLSPSAATYITGFGLIMDPSGTFSTSSLIVGNAYAADYTDPTPTKLTTAISDMETAYNDAAGRILPDYTELYAGDITGQTLSPGLYKWGTGVQVSSGGVTISGSASDVWIFQVTGTLIVGDGAIVTLSGGAQSKNIFWQVADQTTLGTTADFKGIILCKTLIEMQSGATLDGRALAQTAVTLDANTVTRLTIISAIENDLAPPHEYSLMQNYPNPFNPVTIIKYKLPLNCNVKLSVFDMTGREVSLLVNEMQNSGNYEIEWNALDFSSGEYFYRLEAGSFVSMKKMIFIK